MLVMVLLSYLEVSASKAMELHGQDSAALWQSPTLDKYLLYIQNLFSPAAEWDYAQAVFKERQQKMHESPLAYYSEKMSLYL